MLVEAALAIFLICALSDNAAVGLLGLTLFVLALWV